MAEHQKASAHPKLAWLKSSLDQLNAVIQGLTNIVLLVAGLSCLVFGALALWVQHNPGLAGTGLTAGLVLLLASSIDRFEVLKGLGMEARTRRLDAALNQATGTLEQLRELAEISSSSIIALNAGVGRWDSATKPRAALETVQRVKRNLQSLHTAEDTIKKILAPWVKTTLIDLLQRLRPTLREPLALVIERAQIELRGRTENTSLEYQAALDRLNGYGAYDGQKLGHIHDWPVEEWSSRLRGYVEGMPIADSERQRLISWVSPWLTRIDYLVQNNDLSDKEEWFTLIETAG